MQSSNKNAWMVRAGRNGIYAEHFLGSGVVSIGWGEVGPITPTDSDVIIRSRFNEVYPDEKPRTRSVWAAQTKRFVRDVEVGDTVATYHPGTRRYHLGIVQSSAELLSRKDGDEDRPEFVRKVEWRDQCVRDALSVSTRNSLGSIATLFRISPKSLVELRQLCSGEDPSNYSLDESREISEESDDVDILEEYIAQSEQFVEDKIAKLDWQQVQGLVAGIIRAMGYRTRVSPPGPDRGVDIFASHDGLGLTEPRIFVEVKHRAGTVSAPEVRSFLGGRRAGDRCLYVSTGGFSTEARYEAERSQIPLTLLAMPDLRQLLVENYETLDSETRALVPLRKVFWPVSE